MALLKYFFCPNGIFSSQSLVLNYAKKESIIFEKVKYKVKGRGFFTSTWKCRKQINQDSKPAQTFSYFNQGQSVEPIKVYQKSYSLLWKPFVFTLGFSGLSFVGTAIWQYENVRKKALSLLQKNWFTDTFSYGNKKYGWRQEFNKVWSQFTEGQKLFAPICLINMIVFFAWKIKRFHPTMIKYFCSSPYGEVVCLPMILSTFSHYSFFHLAANMYVLHSFSTSGVQDLGKEQFLGLYLAGGVVSSFISYLYKVVKMQNTLSIGASGAIMAMVAYICSKYPDSKLSIVLLPWIVFSAGNGIKFIIGLDILGTLRGWRYFDHAAHLGGSLFGLGWCYWGNVYIWRNREPLLVWWNDLRSSK